LAKKPFTVSSGLETNQLILTPGEYTIHPSDANSAFSTLFESNTSNEFAGPQSMWGMDVFKTLYPIDGFYNNSYAGLRFSDDGTYIYIPEEFNNSITQLKCEEPWNYLRAKWDGTLMLTNELRDTPNTTNAPGLSRFALVTGFTLDETGTKCWAIESGYESLAIEYSLSDAWNVVSATHVTTHHLTEIGTGNTVVDSDTFITSDLQFGSNGSILYVAQGTYSTPETTARVKQFNLSEAYNVATASYSGNELNPMPANTVIQTLTFKPDGMRFWASGSLSDFTGTDMHVYDMSEAWNLATATLNTTVDFTNSSFTDNQTTFFDTYRMIINWVSNTSFVLAAPGDGLRVRQFQTTSEWDIETVNDHSFYVDRGGKAELIWDMDFSPDGKYVFYSTSMNSSIYSMKLNYPFDIYSYEKPTPQESLSKIGGIADRNNPTFSSTYVGQAKYNHLCLGSGNQQTPANTIFNPTSAAWIQLHPNGDRIYVSNQYGESRIYEMYMTEVWNVATATFGPSYWTANTSETTALTSSTLRGYRISNDGSKLYVPAPEDQNGGDSIIYQYSMSEAWNLATATYDSISLDMNAYYNANSAYTVNMSFSKDGTSLFVSYKGDDNTVEKGNKVYQVELAQAWNVGSSSTVTQRVLGSGRDDEKGAGIHFDAEGTYMYWLDQSVFGAVFGWTQYPKTIKFDVSTGNHFTWGDPLLYYWNRYNWDTGSTPMTDPEIRFEFVNVPDIPNSVIPVYVTLELDNVTKGIDTYDFSAASLDTAKNDGFVFVNHHWGNSHPLMPDWVNDFDWSIDGTKLYMLQANSTVTYFHEYEAREPWNLSTVSKIAQHDYSSGGLSATQNHFFEIKPDGRKIFIMRGEGTSEYVKCFDIEEAWNLATINTTETGSWTASVSAEYTTAFTMSPDGRYFYYTNTSGRSTIRSKFLGFNEAWTLDNVDATEYNITISGLDGVGTLNFFDSGTEVLSTDIRDTGTYYFQTVSLGTLSSSYYVPSLTESLDGQIDWVNYAAPDGEFQGDFGIRRVRYAGEKRINRASNLNSNKMFVLYSGRLFNASDRGSIGPQPGKFFLDVSIEQHVPYSIIWPDNHKFSGGYAPGRRAYVQYCTLFVNDGSNTVPYTFPVYESDRPLNLGRTTSEFNRFLT